MKTIFILLLAFLALGMLSSQYSRLTKSLLVAVVASVVLYISLT